LTREATVHFRDKGAASSLSRRGLLADLAGVGLVAASFGWVLWVGHATGGRATDVAGLLAASAGIFAVGRLLGSAHRLLVPALMVAAAGAVAGSAGDDLFSSEPLSGPFGYSTARAALFVQAGVAGLMLAVGARHPGAKAVGGAAAAGSAAVSVASGSAASVVLLWGLSALALLILATKGARVAVAACGALFLAAFGATVVLGATYAPGPRSGVIDRVVDATLTERRVALWHDGLVIMIDRPDTGVGPGRFQFASPVARSDADARWAHNGFLQQGAETGVIGLVLTVLLFGWGFVRLGAGVPDAVTALGGAALAALGIHASIDYILHFAGVPLAAAVLVGGATAIIRNDADGRAWGKHDF
jgi:O-antigen ligase